MVNQSFASHGRAATAAILLLIALASGSAEGAKSDDSEGAGLTVLHVVALKLPSPQDHDANPDQRHRATGQQTGRQRFLIPEYQTA